VWCCATLCARVPGYNVSGVVPNIGLEQEFFLIPREAYYKRPDLQLSGRTIMGRSPPRGQELCDHYMAPLNQVAMKCMQEIQYARPPSRRRAAVAPRRVAHVLAVDALDVCRPRYADALLCALLAGTRAL
jgi:hypothetical protein